MVNDETCDLEIEMVGRVFKGHLFHDYYTKCRTHETKSGPWHSSDAAYHYFRCDPTGMQFLIVQDNSHSIEDLSGLIQLMKDVHEDNAYGFGNLPNVRYYLIQSDEKLTHMIPLTETTSDEGFDSNDYAYPEVTVRRADTNETVATFGYRIDGRV